MSEKDNIFCEDMFFEEMNNDNPLYYIMFFRKYKLEKYVDVYEDIVDKNISDFMLFVIIVLENMDMFEYVLQIEENVKKGIVKNGMFRIVNLCQFVVKRICTLMNDDNMGMLELVLVNDVIFKGMIDIMFCLMNEL